MRFCGRFTFKIQLAHLILLIAVMSDKSIYYSQKYYDNVYEYRYMYYLLLVFTLCWIALLINIVILLTTFTLYWFHFHTDMSIFVKIWWESFPSTGLWVRRSGERLEFSSRKAGFTTWFTNPSLTLYYSGDRVPMSPSLKWRLLATWRRNRKCDMDRVSSVWRMLTDL